MKEFFFLKKQCLATTRAYIVNIQYSIFNIQYPFFLFFSLFLFLGLFSFVVQFGWLIFTAGCGPFFAFAAPLLTANSVLCGPFHESCMNATNCAALR
jgi:hypothetical protein